MEMQADALKNETLTNPRKHTLSAHAPQHPKKPTVVMQHPAMISRKGEVSTEMASYGSDDAEAADDATPTAGGIGCGVSATRRDCSSCWVERCNAAPPC